MQSEIDYILGLLKTIDTTHKLNIKDNKEKIIIDNWIILNNTIYNKYKNKIIISNIEYIPEGDALINGMKLFFETKKLYGYIKYNAHYVTFVISETEYGLNINPMYLIAVNSKILENYNKNINKLPKFKSILKILGWRINKKALQNLKDQVFSIDE